MTPPGTVNATDQARLIDYLTNYNGNLYMEGTKIGFDHFGSSMLTHFGVKFDSEGDFYEVHDLTAQNDDLMDEIDFVYAGGESPHYMVDRLVSTGAEVIYTSEDDFQRTFAYNENDNYKVITSSVLFSALKDADSLRMKPYLMAEMVNYFLDIGTTTGIDQLVDSKNNVTATSYPNPFSVETNIEFILPASGNVKVDIFNSSGRLITQLVNRSFSAGRHVVTWNALDHTGQQAGRGIYYYRIITEQQTGTGKLILK
jgi:hypothetical protein